MELNEMIKVMQHYDNGGWIECSEDNFESVLCEANKKDDGNLDWDWYTFAYRIKEQKEKVTIEKWLCEYEKCENLSGSTRFFILEKAVPFKFAGKKIKLLKTYEVEI